MTLAVIVEADGGARGNPGPAGYGAVVRDAATGEVLAERAEALGVTTNNVAEYQGLIAGLRAAVELGATEVEARLDSKLVVEQMNGRWKVRQPHLQPLAGEAAALVRRLRTVRFQWVPRARNQHADRLANEAMDAAAGTSRPRSTASRRAPASGGDADADPDAGRSPGPAPRRDTPSLDPAAGRSPAPARSDTSSLDPEGGRSPAAPDRAASPAGSGAPATANSREPSLAAAAQTAPPASWIGATGSPTRLLLLRHAQTEHSAARRYSGRGDVPLTQLGERQAEALAHRLSGKDPAVADGVAAVVTSPLRRCRRTAELVAAALGAPLVVHSGLTEVDFGAWEGLTFAEAAASHPQLHPRWLADSSVATPGGESFDEVHRRVRRVRDELIARYGASTLVLVSHVTPIKTLLRMALDAGPSLFFRLHLDLASLSVVEFYPDGAAVVSLVNDTSHLP